eukprot:5625942-Pyramimonas_sp.AAC.1
MSTNCVKVPHVWVLAHRADVEPVTLKCTQTTGLVLAEPAGHSPGWFCLGAFSAPGISRAGPAPG